jgi:hypothetical protein
MTRESDFLEHEVRYGDKVSTRLAGSIFNHTHISSNVLECISVSVGEALAALLTAPTASITKAVVGLRVGAEFQVSVPTSKRCWYVAESMVGHDVRQHSATEGQIP